MRLYHGSYCRIDRIDLALSRSYKDFGAGFYLTADYSRALKMANRRVDLNNTGSAEINAFIFNPSTCPAEIKIKEFKSNDWEWAEFVMNNRDKTKHPPFTHGYDIVIGPVADSRVDPIIEQYREEYGDDYLDPKNLAVLAARLKYPGPIYRQYCFCTDRALNYLIRD